MKAYLTLAILVISAFIFSGCVREVEVPIKLPIYEKAHCKEAHRVKTGPVVVIGRGSNITMEDIERADATFIVVPKQMSKIELEMMFLYTKPNALNLTDCIRWERNRGDKYEAFNLKNNEGL